MKWKFGEPISYVQQANDFYAGHKNFKKALAAGTAMDNSLKIREGHTTNTHFMMHNFLKYFSFEVLYPIYLNNNK